MAAADGKYTVISNVIPGGIADELGVKPGDILLLINGRPVMDVFEYRILEKEEYLTMTFFLKDENLEQTVEIEKDEDELLGLEFENPMMCNCSSCHNKCIFCFIDQLPSGMRPSLYFKDDDMRMSFLTGNYVTLTNMTDDEFERLLSYHLSPMNISVHTTDGDLRSRMLNNRFAGRLLERMERIAGEGIEMNCQFVLCPGINDGDALEKSVADLERFGDSIKSIACVPVGLTRFREENGLYPLRRYDKAAAEGVLDIIDRWQKRFLEIRGTRLLYAGDEFYIRAGRDIPSADEYEGYPQLENGVGLLANYIDETNKVLDEYEKRAEEYNNSGLRVWELTGTDAYAYHESFDSRISRIFNIEFRTVGIVNDFFGHTITVTGLLTGSDIIRQVNERSLSDGKPDLIIISDCMLKADEDIFLDDVTLEQVEKQTGTEFTVSSGAGATMRILEKAIMEGDRHE